MDRAGFFMVDRSFRDLMVLPDGTHEIAITLNNHEEDLQKITDEVVHLAKGLDVLNWRQLQPIIAQMIDSSEAGTFVMMFIVYTAIGMVILNAMLMNVFERIHEIGVMKAIGFSPWNVAGMLFSEAMLQAAAACILTLIFGLPVVYYFQTHGIDLSSLTSSTAIVGIAMDPVWYCRITLKSIATPIIFLFLLAGLAVIYPAVKAALIRPVEAIYYR
jgi:ABC-type lipoprotein release transport system permease subunit